MIPELDLDLTDEQAMVQAGARRFVETDLAALDDDRAWAAMAEFAWFGCALPEEAGGFAGGTRMLALIATELGRGRVAAPFVPVAALAAPLLADVGATALLDQVVGGTAKVIAALDDVAPQAAASGARATRGPAGWMLDGAFVGVSGGDIADAFLVSARIDGERPALFQVRADHPGLAVDRYRSFDDRGAANLTLAGLALDDAALLAEGDAADQAHARAIDQALVMSSAEMLGGLEEAFALTRAYLGTRRQFGQPIGEFQVLRHRLADMYIELEQARSMVILGVAALDRAPAADRARLAAAVKARVSKAAHFVAGQAVQLHGGIGVTEEHAVGPIYRRAVTFDLWLGSGAQHVARYAAAQCSDRPPSAVHTAPVT